MEKQIRKNKKEIHICYERERERWDGVKRSGGVKVRGGTKEREREREIIKIIFFSLSAKHYDLAETKCYVRY